jgi:hypothetical protein
MKVHVESGMIEFASGCIAPGVDRNAFLSSSLGIRAEVFVENEPYVTYRIRPEHGVVATVSFVGERLTQVGWIFEMSDEMEREWAEENELKRKELHDRWLAKKLGRPPYCYAWGNLTSEYDPKGCISDIIVSYAR